MKDIAYAETQSLTDKQYEKLRELFENPKPRNRAERRKQAKENKRRNENA